MITMKADLLNFNSTNSTDLFWSEVLMVKIFEDYILQ